MLESRAMRASAPLLAAALCCALPGLCSARAPAGAQREPPVPQELKERVGAWAENYLRNAPEFTATEVCTDQVWTKKGALGSQRTVTSRYTLRRGQTRREWIESRQPLAADNPKTAAASDAPLLPDDVANPLALIARFAERHQGRMKYFFAPEPSESASDAVLVGYRAIARDAPAGGKATGPAGQAWVHPDDGRITRIEEELEEQNRRYTTAVDFVFDEGLKAWVAGQVVVRIFEKGRMQSERIFRYSAFAPAAGSGP